MIGDQRSAIRFEGLARTAAAKNDAIGYDSANGVGAREDSATLAGWFTGLKRQFPLHRLALFGSMARGETLRGSDIDILADVEASIGLDIVILADKLEELTGRKVDLISRRAIKPRLWKQIEAELINV